MPLTSFTSLPASRQGGIAAFASFLIWGLLPLYWRALGALPIREILCLRVLCLFVFLGLYLYLIQGFREIRAILGNKKFMGILLVSAVFLGVTWLVDIWAITSGLVLEVSLGYFITPLLNIFLGRIFFKDHMNAVCAGAVTLALLGVVYQFIALGYFPLTALALGTSFALYGLVRKLAPVEAVNGLFIEATMFLPCALGYLYWIMEKDPAAFSEATTKTWLLLTGLGPATALPLLWFTYGIRRISLTTLGLLQYLTPTTVFLLGIFVFHEALSHDKFITFLCIWSGLFLYTWNSFQTQKKRAAPFALDGQTKARSSIFRPNKR